MKTVTRAAFYLLVSFSILLFTGSSGENPGVTPAQALKMLEEGSSRSIKGTPKYPNTSIERIRDVAKNGQQPFATILSCSDSRVPLEYIFDAGYGDLFVIRVAGNVSDTDEIGSIEYGAVHLSTPVIIVLGHTQCGAVTAVVAGDTVTGSIPMLVEEIGPAAIEAKAELPKASQSQVITRAININVFNSIETLLLRSPEIAELVKEGKTKIIGATYHLDTGGIEWLGEHPLQNEIIKKEEADRKKETIRSATSTTTENSVPADEKEVDAEASTISGEYLFPTWLISMVIIIVIIASYLLLFNERMRIQHMKVGLRLKLASLVTAIECIGCVFIIQRGVSVTTIPQLIFVISMMLLFGILSASSLERSLHLYVEKIKFKLTQD